jgi:hypothetical protein
MTSFYELGWMIRGKEDMWWSCSKGMYNHERFPELEEKTKREVCFPLAER